MGETNIEWCTATWNPVTGCSKVSEGCRHCYAEALSLRFGWSHRPWTHPFAAENVVLHPDRLDQPLRWRDPRIVFANSMSDLFHEQVPFEFIDQVFDIMDRASIHTFQILTKRPMRMVQWFEWKRGQTLKSNESGYNAPPNVWLGTSVENMRAAVERIPDLMAIPTRVRFLSCEPLLGLLDLRKWLNPDTARCRACEGELQDFVCSCPCHTGGGVNWIIAGGESGLKHRPMNPTWPRDLRDQCVAAGVPYFFKQWGGRTPKAGGRELDGRLWDEMPALLIQELLASSKRKRGKAEDAEGLRTISFLDDLS